MLELMIADDNVHFTEHLHYVLTKEKNFRVINISHDGLEAVKNYNALKPDVLLLDLDMPKLDGLGVLEQLTDDKKNIIILTGSPEYRSRFMNAHKVEWILDKGAHDEEIIEKIRSIEKNLTLKKLEQAIENLLNLLSFGPHSKGTSYLRDAISMAYEYPKRYIEMEKIMRQVAAKNGVSNYKNVHSTIDKCIKSTYYKHENPHIFKDLFPDFDIYKISTRNFLESAITYLELETRM